jgi:transposase-like protein
MSAMSAVIRMRRCFRTRATAPPRRRSPARSATSSLAIPRDRNGSFTPQLLLKGSRRLGGLDEMIISLYAGGMTLRDIQHHLASTIGTELSHETISKITDQIAEEVLAWQRRPLEPRRIPLVVANPGVKGFGCPGTHITRCRRRSSAATSS